MQSCIVVGIAGGSASGKSTLTDRLADAVKRSSGHHVLILAADRYMRADRADGPSFLFQATGEMMFDANHPDAVEWDRLLRDLEAEMRRPGGPNIILVEGLMVLHHPGLREHLDLRLFVELDADERVLRRLLRDMQGGRASRDPVFIANYYRESARVGHALYVEPSRVHADLIIRGDADWERLRPLLLALLNDRLAQADVRERSA